MNWDSLLEKFSLISDANELEVNHQLNPDYKVNLPDSYVLFLKYFGAGTLGAFFHFHSPKYMNTHRERLAAFLDDELREMIDENDSGEILIFADTDNGDMLGWKLDDMTGNQEPIIYKIPARSFEVNQHASDVKDLIINLIENPPNHLSKMKLTYQRLS